MKINNNFLKGPAGHGFKLKKSVEGIKNILNNQPEIIDINSIPDAVGKAEVIYKKFKESDPRGMAQMISQILNKAVPNK